MFRRKREQTSTDGRSCPLCQHENPPDAQTCGLCFSPLQQGGGLADSDALSQGVEHSLFGELLESDLSQGMQDDGEVVDWSEHTLTLEDMVEVVEFDDDGGISTGSSTPAFAHTQGTGRPSDEVAAITDDNADLSAPPQPAAAPVPPAPPAPPAPAAPAAPTAPGAPPAPPAPTAPGAPPAPPAPPSSAVPTFDLASASATLAPATPPAPPVTGSLPPPPQRTTAPAPSPPQRDAAIPMPPSPLEERGAVAPPPVPPRRRQQATGVVRLPVPAERQDIGAIVPPPIPPARRPRQPVPTTPVATPDPTTLATPNPAAGPHGSPLGSIRDPTAVPATLQPSTAASAGEATAPAGHSSTLAAPLPPPPGAADRPSLAPPTVPGRRRQKATGLVHRSAPQRVSAVRAPPPLPPRPGQEGTGGELSPPTVPGAPAADVDVKQVTQERLSDRKKKLADARARVEARISVTMGGTNVPTGAPAASGIPERSPTGSVWPWVQMEEGDAQQLRRSLRDAMDQAKRGDTGGASMTLERLGPHLGSNLDLLFHVGVLLRKLDRDEELRMMLEEANRRYPDDPKVAAALGSLS